MSPAALPTAVGPIAPATGLLPIGGAGDQPATGRASLDIGSGSGSDAQATPFPGTFADTLKHHMSAAVSGDGSTADAPSDTKSKSDSAQDQAAPDTGAMAFLPTDLSLALARLQSSSMPPPPADQGASGQAERDASLARAPALATQDANPGNERLPASQSASVPRAPASAEIFAASGKTIAAPTQTAQPLTEKVQNPPKRALADSLRPQTAQPDTATARETTDLPGAAPITAPIAAPGPAPTATQVPAALTAAPPITAPPAPPVTPLTAAPVTAQVSAPAAAQGRAALAPSPATRFAAPPNTAATQPFTAPLAEQAAAQGMATSTASAGTSPAPVAPGVFRASSTTPPVVPAAPPAVAGEPAETSRPQQADATQAVLPSESVPTRTAPGRATTASILPDGGISHTLPASGQAMVAPTHSPAALPGATAQAGVAAATPPPAPLPPSTLAGTVIPDPSAALNAQMSADRPAVSVARRPTTPLLDTPATSAATGAREPALTTLATPVAERPAAAKVQSEALLTAAPPTSASAQPQSDASQANFAALVATHSASVAPHQEAPTPATVQTPFGAPAWSEEVGKNLVWLAGQEQHKAELVLTPPHLGRIEISITINNDQATASFVSANPAVRDALEQALPHLREMLANAGISLGQASVGADSSAGGSNPGTNPGYSGRRGGNLDVAAIAGTNPPTLARPGNGLVDTFA
ncbi:MAG: flagellar hook-length control protein FliK [Rhodocyclaceae bacterium]|nr:flagellar hook-length control protein FliK [Rhodocyclaceae bacterium]